MSLLPLPSNFDPAFFAQQIQSDPRVSNSFGAGTPFSNVAGLGIRGMNFAGSPESPFASSIRPDRMAGSLQSFVNRPPITGGARPMRPPITGGARPMGPSQKPNYKINLPISDDTGFFGPQPPAPFPPPISQPPRPFGGNQFGGIGGFFNQLAMMSPEQYNMGMDRYNQFNQRFGPSMGGGYGMFNQLAQLSPEQYNMGMDRFNQFNQRFGGFPPQNVAPPPMMPQPQFNQYGGGFGGQRFQPQMGLSGFNSALREQQMPQPQFNQYGGGFGGQRFQPQMMPQPQFNQFDRNFGGFNQAPNPFGGSFNSPLRQFMGPQILPFNMQPMMGQPQTSTPMPPPMTRALTGAVNMTPTQGQPQTSIPMPPPSPQQGQLQTSTPMPAAMF